MTRSVAPVFSSTLRTWLQDRPPSVVLKTPRSGLGPKSRPLAATQATSASSGCAMMRAMDCVSRSPMWVKVSPPSSDL